MKVQRGPRIVAGQRSAEVRALRQAFEDSEQALVNYIALRPYAVLRKPRPVRAPLPIPMQRQAEEVSRRRARAFRDR